MALKKSSYYVLLGSAFLLSMAITSTASAGGGFFGEGSPFRGTIGNWIDKHVERPITTPVARKVREAIVVVAGAECAIAAAETGAGAIVAGTACAAVADEVLPK